MRSLIGKAKNFIIKSVAYFLKVTSSKNELFYWLMVFSRNIYPDYRFKWPQMDWWADQEFNKFLEQFEEIDGLNTDRKWILAQLIRLTKNVPGDTAECGVYQGCSSYLILRSNAENRRNNLAKHHYVFDSFEGLSVPCNIDGNHFKKGDLSCPIEKVRANLSLFSDVTLLRGWIPDKFSDVKERTFSFVHIDVDLYEPTKQSIEFFYPRINHGGILLCDDYGFTTCPGATRAIDEFLNDKREKMISLCCGGGFFIKGTDTGHSPSISR